MLMGVSSDLMIFLLTSAFRTMYLILYGILHLLDKPKPLDVGSPEYLEVVRLTQMMRV